MASTLFLILCCFAQVHAGTEISTSGRACHSVLVPIFSEERKKCEFRFDAVQIALMTLISHYILYGYGPLWVTVTLTRFRWSQQGTAEHFLNRTRKSQHCIFRHANQH